MDKQSSVLIVEDEAVMTMCLELVLRRAGFDVFESVATGEDAVFSSEENNPDIILMDIRLSGEMDGIEAAKIINDKNHSKIIFMTGYSNEKIKAKAQELNPVAYLLKPFDNTELISLMRGINKDSK